MTAQPQPTINLTSDRLMYGPLTPDHLERSLRWANDWRVTTPRGMLLRPYSIDKVKGWNEQARTSPDVVPFVVYEKASQRSVGETGFSSINWFHRSAEFGILIGETDAWGQGYGTEATRTMLTYGFAQLGFHSVWLSVSSLNPQGVRAYTRAGFREAGRLREAQLINGQRCDIIYMDCLAAEFRNAQADDGASVA